MPAFLKSIPLLVCAAALFAFSPFQAGAAVKVIASTTDLGALAIAVGGSAVEVTSLAKGTQDPHELEAKPSYLVKMRDAQLVIAHGLELESAWLLPLIRSARNPKIAAGTNGYLELASKVSPIEIPTGEISRAEGDVHPDGNPHFQLDPIRLGQAAEFVAERLSLLDPANKQVYADGAKAYKTRLIEKDKEWSARIKKSGVTEAVTFHRGFAYFFNRYGIKSAIQLEPRPGIPPTASHLLEVVSTMKKRNIKLILIENFYDKKAGEKVQRDIPGVKVATVPVSVGGEEGIATNEQLLERIVKIIEENSK